MRSNPQLNRAINQAMKNIEAQVNKKLEVTKKQIIERIDSLEESSRRAAREIAKEESVKFIKEEVKKQLDKVNKDG